MAEDDDEPIGELTPSTKIPPKAAARYQQIISDIFKSLYPGGSASEFEFERDEILTSVEKLKIKRPKNLGDVIYTFRYRRKLPPDILATQPKGKHWLILGAGDARYRFRLSDLAYVEPTAGLLVRKIPDATPEIITQYALSDEQALLAKIRYNRLIDTFLGVTAYSLQNHLRTKISNYGQIEIDELYVGVDARGAQFIIPVQAKGGK
ncbi:MAG: endonuclease, partial [Acidobacteria bacterium]|nr:endonuclease [Acidobacteriota bacterium]